MLDVANHGDVGDVSHLFERWARVVLVMDDSEVLKNFPFFLGFNMVR